MSAVATAIVASTYIGSKSASKAADTSAAASAAATDAQERMFAKQTELQEPFRQAGITSQNRLLELLGLGGGKKTAEQYRQELLPQFTSGTAPQGTTFTNMKDLMAAATGRNKYVDEAGLNAEIQRRMAAEGTSSDYGKYARDFSMADFQADPGYAFRLSEGQKALDRSAAARGGLISGAALKAATRYGQDMGSQEYTNAFNRYQVNRTNQLNPLQSLMGAGQSATNTLTNAAGNFGNAEAANITNAGNARASGYLGQANALNQGLSSYLNYSNNQALLNRLPVQNLP